MRRAYQPEGSDAGSIDRVKRNDRFDDLTAGDHGAAGSECRGIDPEAGGANLRGTTAQFMAECLVAA